MPYGMEEKSTPGDKLRRMCNLLDLRDFADLGDVSKKCEADARFNACQALNSAMVSAKTTIGNDINARRVFVQDVTASLNRRRLLSNENYNNFQEIGHAYMAQEVLPSHITQLKDRKGWRGRL